VWGIDRHPEAQGAEADKVLECDTYIAEVAPQPEPQPLEEQLKAIVCVGCPLSGYCENGNTREDGFCTVLDRLVEFITAHEQEAIKQFAEKEGKP